MHRHHDHSSPIDDPLLALCKLRIRELEQEAARERLARLARAARRAERAAAPIPPRHRVARLWAGLRTLLTGRQVCAADTMAPPGDPLTGEATM